MLTAYKRKAKLLDTSYTRQCYHNNRMGVELSPNEPAYKSIAHFLIYYCPLSPYYHSVKYHQYLQAANFNENMRFAVCDEIENNTKTVPFDSDNYQATIIAHIYTKEISHAIPRKKRAYTIWLGCN